MLLNFSDLCLKVRNFDLKMMGYNIIPKYTISKFHLIYLDVKINIFTLHTFELKV